MKPDEVLEILKGMGADISRPTLIRYEKQELIAAPKRGGGGRAKGRWTDYTIESVREAYASWALMRGNYGSESMRNFFGGKMPPLSPKAIKMIRLFGLMDNDPFNEENGKKLDSIAKELSAGHVETDGSSGGALMSDGTYQFLLAYWGVWMEEKEKVKEKASK